MEVSVSSALKRAKILFDLNGYIVVRNLLSRDEVFRLVEAVRKNESNFQERTDELRNTKSESAACLAGDGRTGRCDLGGILSFAKEKNTFRSLMVHPTLTPYLNMLLGEGYRLDHDPVVVKQRFGSEGFSLHGGPIKPSGEMDRSLTYSCVNQTIHNSLVAVSFQLTDHNPGDGGFCVVSGSHKMNFGLTEDMLHGRDPDFFDLAVTQPATKAGDCVIFSEATVHGCLAWKNKETDRLIALYRFAPATCAYARGYTEWPKECTANATPEQLSMLEPPYHVRFDRKTMRGGNLHDSPSRSQEKKDFDFRVFMRTYF